MNAENLELVNYVFDINQEFNTKIFIIIMLFFYAILLILWSRNKKADCFSMAFLLVGAKSFIFLTLFNLPLMTILLYRGVKLETLIIIILTFYSLAYLVLLGFVQFWTLEFIRKLFMWGAGYDITKRRTKRTKNVFGFMGK